MSEQAYCVKCKDKRDYKYNPVYKEFDTSKGKKGSLIGECAICGTKMSKIVRARSLPPKA